MIAVQVVSTSSLGALLLIDLFTTQQTANRSLSLLPTAVFRSVEGGMKHQHKQ
jgi:hypothetical protein